MVRLLAILLIPLMLTHSWIYVVPNVAYAEEKVTVYPPETEEVRPVEEAKPAKKGISKWWYVLILAAAGGAAAGSGGGGDNGGGGSTGTSTVTW
ncbi:MAG: hypothetical protein HY786_07115 [Deltaproteobacteria bacterium]|nr:hypothetical protein [Deltaproteobacteria bacterium]